MASTHPPQKPPSLPPDPQTQHQELPAQPPGHHSIGQGQMQLKEDDHHTEEEENEEVQLRCRETKPEDKQEVNKPLKQVEQVQEDQDPGLQHQLRHMSEEDTEMQIEVRAYRQEEMTAIESFSPEFAPQMQPRTISPLATDGLSIQEAETSGRSPNGLSTQEAETSGQSPVEALAAMPPLLPSSVDDRKADVSSFGPSLACKPAAPFPLGIYDSKEADNSKPSALKSDPAIDNSRSSHNLPCDQIESVLQSCIATAQSHATHLLQQAMGTVQEKVLHALHQVALDIVERVGKDASSRIFMSERKAVLFEQELCSVKQQALSMLLRLKADADAQIKESEKRFLSERKRAQDAEAKLAATQEMSRRLKLELKKKGEILDKMQKLVQPVNGDHYDKPYTFIDSSGKNRLADLVSKSTHHEVLHSSTVKSVENKILQNRKRVFSELPRMMMQKADKLVAQSHEMVLDFDKDKRMDTMKTVSTEGLEQVRQQGDLLCEKPDNTLVAQKVHELKMAPCETSLNERSLVDNRDADKENTTELNLPTLDIERAKNQVNHVDASAVNRYADNIENSKVLAAADFMDLRTTVDSGICTKRVDANETSAILPSMEEASDEAGRVLPNHCSPISTLTEGCVTREACVASSYQFQNGGKCETLEVEQQILDTQTCHEVCIAQSARSSSVCPLGDIVNGENPSPCEKDSGLLTEAFTEFPRDYEAATSLAELAVTCKEAGDHSGEASVSNASRRESEYRPRVSGPRMKRKRSVLEKKHVLGFQVESMKKMKATKGYPSSLDYCKEKYTRRSKPANQTTSKDNIGMESSRDSRRLMQGARQLLCLSEKKW